MVWRRPQKLVLPFWFGIPGREYLSAFRGEPHSHGVWGLRQKKNTGVAPLGRQELWDPCVAVVRSGTFYVS